MINCRFLSETSYERVENFCSASLNLSAYDDYTGKMMENFFEREYGSVFLGMAFPVGFAQTEDWLRKVAAFFERPEAAEKIIAENKTGYMNEVTELSHTLRGKRLMIITFNHELDWILQAAIDVGIEIVKIGILDFSQDEGFRTNLNVKLPVEENYDRTNRERDIEEYKPDILLTNYASSLVNKVSVADTIPMCPDVGFFSGLIMIRRWAKLLKLSLKGEWTQDERLFKKYYAR